MNQKEVRIFEKLRYFCLVLVNRIRVRLPVRLGILFQHPPVTLNLPKSYKNPETPIEPGPAISIVTPAYNHAVFLERTIRSVLDQNCSNLEYFVQDGGSTDGTIEILEKYAHRLSGWESKPDNGQAQAINWGMSKTTGEIMAWLNSDDILLPGTLAYVADFFNKNPSIDVVYGHRMLINENDLQIGRWMLPAHDNKVLSWADFVPQETLFWRRSIWDKVGAQIDESFQFAMDWDLLLRFREAGARFARLPRFLGGFRVHPQQKSLLAVADIGIKEMNRIRTCELGKVPTERQYDIEVSPYLVKHVMTDLKWRILNKMGAFS